jgi:hypothetical protein
MLMHKKLMPKFIKSIPRQLEPGVLYVSLEYETAVHSCCCGCGQEVVTPLTPTDWRLTNISGKVSLWPSVGNWNLACRTHYVIRDNQVLEAGPWSDKKIQAEQRRDKAAKADYFANLNQPQQPRAGKATAPASKNSSPVLQESMLKKIWRWIAS